jgi:hypothetical protein
MLSSSKSNRQEAPKGSRQRTYRRLVSSWLSIASFASRALRAFRSAVDKQGSVLFSYAHFPLTFGKSTRSSRNSGGPLVSRRLRWARSSADSEFGTIVSIALAANSAARTLGRSHGLNLSISAAISSSVAFSAVINSCNRPRRKSRSAVSIRPATKSSGTWLRAAS